ncbi:hypothetical protein ACNF31_11475, partial [Staphylococcus aureus]
EGNYLANNFVHSYTIIYVHFYIDIYTVSYAIQCNVDIEPLRVLIGDNKNGDVFTERDWEATVRSASR